MSGILSATLAPPRIAREGPSGVVKGLGEVGELHVEQVAGRSDAVLDVDNRAESGK